MYNFFSLLKIQAITFLSGSNSKKKKLRKTKKGIGAIFVGLLLFFAIGLCGHIYSNMFGEVFKVEDKLNELLPTMISLSAFVCFVFSYYSVNSLIFKSKDYDLLSSLPIKTHTIVISKLAFSILFDILISIVVVIPSLMNYKTLGGDLTGTCIAVNVIFALFSPFVTSCISIVLSFIIALISTRFKNKSIIQTVITFLLTVAILAVVFTMSTDNASNLQKGFTKIYFLYPWLSLGQTNVLYLILYVGVSLISFIAVTAFVCCIYKWVNSKLKAVKTNKKFRLKNYEVKSPVRALLRKEIKTLFSCPIYAINCFFGQILAVIASVVFIIITRATNIASSVDLMPYVPLILSFMFLLSPLTTPSVSLEGQSLWVLKTSPVKFSNVFNAKILNHILFSTIPALVVGVLFSIACSQTVYAGILLTLCAILFSVFAGISGLILNILFPSFNWTNEAKVVKQSLPVFLQTIVAFVITGIIGVVLYLLINAKVNINTLLFLGGINVVLLGLSATGYSLIIKKGEKWLNKRL